LTRSFASVFAEAIFSQNKIDNLLVNLSGRVNFLFILSFRPQCSEKEQSTRVPGRKSHRHSSCSAKNEAKEGRNRENRRERKRKTSTPKRKVEAEIRGGKIGSGENCDKRRIERVFGARAESLYRNGRRKKSSKGEKKEGEASCVSFYLILKII
jgi:hypothetical protein